MQGLNAATYVSVKKQPAIKINVRNEKIKFNTVSKKEIHIKIGEKKP